MSQFAPNPIYGAAYAVALQAVGGVNAVAGCATHAQFVEIRMKLDLIKVWSDQQGNQVRKAYDWGINKVDADARGRLSIYDNARAVQAALAAIPKPPPPAPPEQTGAVAVEPEATREATP